METLGERTIGQIVAADYRNASVFKKFNIDFSCSGELTIDEACKGRRVSPSKLWRDLEKTGKDGTANDVYNNLSLDSLIDYIIKRCHRKSREKLRDVKSYAKKVANLHGPGHGELVDACHELLVLKNVKITHMNDEEERLFPSIKELTGKNDHPDKFDKIHSARMIKTMQDEHKDVRSALKRIRRISHKHQFLADASATYKMFYGKLAALDGDLRKHLHLENNILFPKVLNLIQFG